MTFLIVFFLLLAAFAAIRWSQDSEDWRKHRELEQAVNEGRAYPWGKHGNRYFARVPFSFWELVGPWLILVALAAFIALAAQFGRPHG